MRGLLVLTLVLLGACGSEEKSTTIDGTTYTRNEAEGTATVSNEEATVSVAEGAAAAKTEFPDFAPQYPGATVESSMVTQTKEGKRTMLVITTKDDLTRVMDFYRNSFTAAGMKISMAHSAEDSAMLAAEGDGKNALLAGGRENGKTSFSLSFSGV